MSQYLLAVNHTPDDLAALQALPPEEMQAMFDATDKVNDRMQAEGVWVFGGGLMSHDATTTVDNTGAELVVTDGPFAESKEHLGGFWIIDVPDLDAALQWAAEGSKACGNRIQVRPFEEDPGA